VIFFWPPIFIDLFYTYMYVMFMHTEMEITIEDYMYDILVHVRLVTFEFLKCFSCHNVLTPK
jgi:hypothetical protein